MTLKEKTITNTKKTNKKEIKIMKKEIDINKNEIYTSEKKSGFMKNNRGNNFRQGFRKEEIIMKNENFKKENNKRTNDKRGKVVAEKYLNKSQFDAVKNTDGYVRVIAGAGTGKTRTLTSRYLYITKKKGISPENILCITFTNKAAKEMQNRIEKIVGKRDLKYVCTFHKLCIQILKEECHRIGYPSDFVILDEEDSDGIINKILKDNNIKNMTVKDAKESLKRFKEFKNDDGRTYINILLENEEKELHELYVKAGDNFMKLLAGYMYEQKKCFGLGFEDLLKLTIYTLKTYEDVRLKWQKKFRYIMVDEFQDVNDSQYEICKILSGYHKNLFVVGDPDQTIYSWRGAKVEYINNFDKDFPECMTIMMNKNYRSSGNIMNVANSLISKNKNRIEKSLIPVQNEGNRVVYIRAENAEEQAQAISQQILLLKSTGVKLTDIAVLYRANYLSHKIEESFIANKISYSIYNGISFYERKEIKDALSYLRMITKRDDMSFLRTINTPNRDFGDEKIRILEEYANNNGCTLYEALKYNIDNEDISNPNVIKYIEIIEKFRRTYHKKTVSELIDKLLHATGYEDMVKKSCGDDAADNLLQLIYSVVEYENSIGKKLDLNEYLENINLYTDIQEQKNNGVKMMTIHSAKGLEFPYVFVCSMNEGDFPNIKTSENEEEERRLAYVACTRAQKGLYLSSSEEVNFFGMKKEPSRFISDIDKDLLYCIEKTEKKEAV